MPTDYRCALITGASSGLGAALARDLARRQVALHLFGRDSKRLEEVRATASGAGVEAWSYRIDIRDRAALTEALLLADARKPVDLVVANAGVGGEGLLAGPTGEDPEAVSELIEVSFAGAVNTVLSLIPRFVARGEGHIVLVGSLAGLAAIPSAPAYSAVKAAIHVYGDALAGMLAGTGVSVSVAQPGFIDTPGSAWITTPRPGLMSADAAAAAMLAGIRAKRRRVRFPFGLGLATRLLGLLPPRIRNAVWNSVLSAARRSVQDP